MCRLTLLVALLAVAACNRRTASQAPNSAPIAADRSARTEAPVSGGLQSFADVVDRASPAVVTIRSARRVRAPQQFPFFDDPFFRRLFGDRSAAPSRAPALVESALGSGLIVNANGQILTNHHVVDGAEEIAVELSSQRTYSAKLVGSDPPSDLAVLEIRASGLPNLSLGDSDAVRVGDLCLALGNPLGVGETVTAGIISAKAATPA